MYFNWINHFCNVFKFMDISCASEEPFHPHASSYSVSKAGIHFKTLLGARSDKPRTSFAVVKSNLLCAKYV